MYHDSLNLKINPARCVRCGVCMQECVNDVLVWGKGGFPAVFEKGGTDRCIHCHHCMMVCPRGALSIDGVDPKDCEATEDYPVYERLAQLVRGRRSVRHFKQFNVKKEELLEVLSSMKYVPTGVNHHSLHFSVISDMDAMSRFRNLLYRKLLELLAKPNLTEKEQAYLPLKALVEHRKDPVFRTAPHMLLVSVAANAPCGKVDPVIALSYFELLANAAGIGTLWCGRVINLMNDLLPELYNEFDIPAGWVPGYAMLFGYAEAEFFRNNRPVEVGFSWIDGQSHAAE